jgi:hypothetical protein
MTTSRIGAAAIALSIAFGFVGAIGSTENPANAQNLSGTIASSKRMADGRTVHFLDVVLPPRVLAPALADNKTSPQLSDYTITTAAAQHYLRRTDGTGL